MSACEAIVDHIVRLSAALAGHVLVAAYGAEGVICDDPAAATRVHSGLCEAADVRLELRIPVWREGHVDL